jgi:hypothetical protein
MLKSETYHFHRLDLTRQAGFIVTIYDEDGLRLASTTVVLNSCRGFCRGAQDRRQQGGRATKQMTGACRQLGDKQNHRAGIADRNQIWV